MAHILLTGIATLDIINYVDHYPIEDEEFRTLKQAICRGGNASNTATVLAQFQHQCFLLCTLSDDSSGQVIQKDLKDHNILFSHDTIITNQATPTSYITLNTQNGSRTIIHHRDLNELTFQQFDTIDLKNFDWFHFEGRNVSETKYMMQKARTFNKPISIEIEKDRSDIECLFELADIILISKAFVKSQNYISVKEYLEHLSEKYPHKIITCTWGDEGAWLHENTIIQHHPAVEIKNIKDTIGAGDTFNAAVINALIQKKNMSDVLHDACMLASLKCGQNGFENLVNK